MPRFVKAVRKKIVLKLPDAPEAVALRIAEAWYEDLCDPKIVSIEARLHISRIIIEKSGGGLSWNPSDRNFLLTLHDFLSPEAKIGQIGGILSEPRARVDATKISIRAAFEVYRLAPKHKVFNNCLYRVPASTTGNKVCTFVRDSQEKYKEGIL